MHFTSEQLSNHTFWASLAALERALDEFDSQGDAMVLERVAELRGVVSLAEQVREIPAWRIPGVAGTANDGLSQIEAHIKALCDLIVQQTSETPLDANRFLESTGSHLDAASTAFQALPSMLAPEKPSSGTVAAKIAGDAASALRKLRAEQKSLTEELATARTGIEVAKADDVARVKALNEAIDEASKKNQQRLDSWEDNARKAGEAHSAVAEELLADLRAKQEQARNLLHGTARWTISADYAKYARLQGWAGTAWSIAGVLVAAGGAVAMYVALTNVDAMTTQETILKTTLSTALLSVAGVMGSKGAGHHKQARDAKRVQLDLNAFEPFIQLLDEPDQKSMRIATASWIFARPQAGHRNQPEDPVRQYLVDLGQTALTKLGLPTPPKQP